jgi:hypothetical protein
MAMLILSIDLMIEASVPAPLNLDMRTGSSRHAMNELQSARGRNFDAAARMMNRGRTAHACSAAYRMSGRNSSWITGNP